MNALRQLRARAANVVFDSARCTFLVAGRPMRGLTPIVRALVPVRRHERVVAETCTGCARARAAAAAETRARAAGARGISAARVLRAAGGRRAIRCGGGAAAAAHGTHVDDELARYVRAPRSFAPTSSSSSSAAARLDPCVVGLLAHLAAARLRPLACQVPIASSALRFATAIDVVCADAHGRLHVLEVKATRLAGAGTSTESSADCYEHVPPRSRQCAAAPGVLRRSTYVGTCRRPQTPGSPDDCRYWQHQLQLWAMVRVLEREYGLVLGGAAVVRTSPAGVAVYPLARAALANVDGALVAAFAAAAPPPARRGRKRARVGSAL